MYCIHFMKLDVLVRQCILNSGKPSNRNIPTVIQMMIRSLAAADRAIVGY